MIDKSRSGGDGLPEDDKDSLCELVSRLGAEVRELRRDNTSLAGRIRLLEGRMGRGLHHPCEPVAGPSSGPR